MNDKNNVIKISDKNMNDIILNPFGVATLVYLIKKKKTDDEQVITASVGASTTSPQDMIKIIVVLQMLDSDFTNYVKTIGISKGHQNHQSSLSSSCHPILNR